jgi:hypothetical protein
MVFNENRTFDKLYKQANKTMGEQRTRNAARKTPQRHKLSHKIARTGRTGALELLVTITCNP